MRTLYRPTLLLIALALLLSAAGCVSPPPQAKGPVTVKVLTMQQAGPTPDEMNAIVDEFNKANANIKVEIEYVSYDALHDKITTALATNPPAYDAILVDDPWYAEFVKAGYLWDVTNKIDQQTKDKVFSTAWDVTSINKKIYGMPWLLDTKYLFYNKKMLNDAGFTAPPATWEELLTQARAIKQKGLVEYPIVWSWNQAEAAVCDFVSLLAGNGGRLVNDQGQPVFNDPAGVATTEWMKKTIDEGLSNPASTTYVEEDVRNVFSQGKAAFALNWNYMYDMANFNQKESTVVGNVGMTTIPVFAGKTKAPSQSINGSMGFSVVDKSPNREEAWKYIQFLTSEPIQQKYSAHMLPIYSTNFEGDSAKALMALNQSNPVTVPAFKAQFPYANVRPRAAFYQEGSKALQLALQQALSNQKSPKEALDAAAATWSSLASAK